MSHQPLVFILIVAEVFGAIVFYSLMRKCPLTDKNAVAEASAVVYKLALASGFCHNKTLAVDPVSSSSKDTDWSCHTPTGSRQL